MNDKKYEKPLHVDMDFNEALERFAGTDRAEMVAVEAKPKRPQKMKAKKLLTWIKKLSKTDAQQETSGGLVPYLRLTKSSLDNEDFQTWFRDTLFDNAPWVAGTFGKEQVEEATIPFKVSVNDIQIGTQTLKVTHGVNRQHKNNTPNTWLHWNAQLESMLQLNDFTDLPVRITRESSGVFRLDIHAAADIGVI